MSDAAAVGIEQFDSVLCSSGLFDVGTLSAAALSLGLLLRDVGANWGRPITYSRTVMAFCRLRPARRPW